MSLDNSYFSLTSFVIVLHNSFFPSRIFTYFLRETVNNLQKENVRGCVKEIVTNFLFSRRYICENCKVYARFAEK